MIASVLPFTLIKLYDWRKGCWYLRDELVAWLDEHNIQYMILHQEHVIKFEKVEDHVLFKLTWL